LTTVLLAVYMKNKTPMPFITQKLSLSDLADLCPFSWKKNQKRDKEKK